MISSTGEPLSPLLVAICALAACGGKTEDRGTTPATAPAPVAAVELGEMTLWDGDEAALRIHADGSTEMGFRSGGTSDLKPGQTWSSDSLPLQLRPGPAIQADGTVAFKGEPRVRINADGTITDLRAGTAFPILVTGDKVTITSGGHRMGFDVAADGSVTVFGGKSPPRKPLRLEGADTPGKRRTILAFISLNFLGREGTPAGGAGSATPAVP